MDGQAIVENYRRMTNEVEFTELNIDRLLLHNAKYIIRLLSPVLEFKRTGETLNILKKTQGILETMSINEYRHYMAFTLIPDVERIIKNHNDFLLKSSSLDHGLVRCRRFSEVRDFLKELFPEMDLTVDPRKGIGESWSAFIRNHRPNFAPLTRVLYNISYTIPGDALLSYLTGPDHDNWIITSDSD